MHDAGDFLSCDWGTSSFRLRWIAGPDAAILREIRTDAGCKALFDQASARGDRLQAGRAQVYSTYLRERLAEWEGLARHAVPIVISGMASSTIGWHEVPYTQVPFALNGHQLKLHPLEWDQPSWIGSTWLVPGVRTAVDIMRGEETEAAGLLAEPGLADWREDCLLILPGTHSKHLRIRGEAIVDIRTCMTGELFSVLASHSLLRASTDLSALKPDPSQEHHHAFTEGVLWAKDRGLAQSLFRTRTRAVLDGCPPAANTWFLSGLLIGAELQSVPDDIDRVLLGGAASVSELYQLAARLLFPKAVETVALPASQVERAAVLGHLAFLKNLRQ